MRRILHLKLLSWLLIVAGVTGLVAAAVLFVGQSRPPQVHTHGPGHVAVDAAPSAVKPSAEAVGGYDVVPTLPKYITIPALGVEKTRVLHLGLKQNNEIATPDNVFDTGWYRGSVKPGEAGAMFMYGHVSTWEAKGVFYDLKKLRPGDTVTVTRGDNKTFTYLIVSTKRYPHDKVNMQEVLVPVEGSAAGLNLMTCAGKVLAGTNDFSERLVVFTRLVKD
jgi:sortase (surface protein transpeptidase)